MTAPDKLYVHITPHLGLLEATAIPVDAPGEQVYIREDALMEWASKMLGQVSDMGFDDGDVEHGYTRALQDLIDKLNSM